MHRINIKHILVEEFGIDLSMIVFVEDGIKAYNTVINALKLSNPDIKGEEMEEKTDIEELCKKN